MPHQFIRFLLLLVLIAAIAGPLPVRADAPLPKLEIVSPKDGQQVTPGKTVKIQVSGGQGISNALIVAQRPLKPPKDTAKAMEFDLEVPVNIPEGTYYIKAMSEVDGEYIESEEIHLDIKWPQNPVAMVVKPSTIAFDALGKSQQLEVTGTFSNGESFDITRANKTTYVSEDPLTIGVSPQGIVSALKAGSAILKVKNGDMLRGVSVTAVSSRYDNLVISTVITVLPVTVDKDGNYLIPLIISNKSTVPLPAVQLTSATLGIMSEVSRFTGAPTGPRVDVKAKNLPQLKKDLGFDEQWTVPLIFSRRLDKGDLMGQINIQGLYSIYPEGHYDPKEITYEALVDLP